MLTPQEIQQIAKSTADEVIERIHRYPLEYKEPDNVEDGLRESMSEELTAADWYRRRAANARSKGDETTSQLYEKIANDEENEHYVWFSDRLKQIGGEP